MRTRDIKLDVIFKRKRYAPAVLEEQVNAKDIGSLQALLDVVRWRWRTKMQLCGLSMKSFLRVEGFLARVHSLRKTDAHFVGSCMAGFVWDSALEESWRVFMRTMCEASRGCQRHEVYDGGGDRFRLEAIGGTAGSSTRPAPRAMRHKVGPRLLLFFC